VEDEQYNPYLAIITDKDPAAQQQFFERFYRLDQPTKDFLTSEEVTGYIKGMFAQGVAPETHAVAISKIIALAAMGDIPVESVEQILQKLELTPAQAQKITLQITTILEPLSTQRKQQPRAPATPGAPITSAPPTRNVLNLKKH